MSQKDLTPEQIDEFLDKGMIFYGGIKINNIFYTWEDLDSMEEKLW